MSDRETSPDNLPLQTYNDQAAFFDTVAESYDRIHGHLTCYFVDRGILPEDAKELASHAMEIALRRGGNSRVPIDEYIGKIGRGIMQWLREKDEPRPISLEMAEQLGLDTSNDGGISLIEARLSLCQMVEDLPPHLRQAFILKQVVGLPVDEAAPAVGCATSTMYVNSSEATRSLKQRAQTD